MRAIIVVTVLALTLAGCAGLTTSAQQSTGSGGTLAKVQAGAAYFAATLTKIQTALDAAKAEMPAQVAKIQATIEPAVAAARELIAQYTAAVAARDTGAAESLWSRARAGLSTALTTAARVLGPKLLAGLLGA